MTQSELESYLTKHATLVPLGEKKATDTSGSIVSYPWPWADPNIESQTNAYQIARHWTLPVEFQEKARQCKSEERRVYANEAEKYLILTSSNTIHVYFYTETPISIQLTVPQRIQYIQLMNENQSAIGVSLTGQVYYWQDIHEDRFIDCTVSLLCNKEHITAMTLLMDSSQMVLGTSSGELYLIRIKHPSLVQSTFYKPTTGVVSYITGIFHTHLPHVSQTELPAHAEPILQIKAMENIIYAVSKRFILVWKIHSMTEIELVSHINLSSKIVSGVAQHIPASQLSKGNIKYEVIDMDLIADGEVVLLVSYHVPVMGDYVQYALISIVMQPFYTEAQVVYTTSIPYSAIAHTVTPELRVTRALGFVTLNNAVVSVSLDRRSVFEESVVLRKDQVLATFIQEYTEFIKVYVFTLESGVIEFVVCIDEIQGQRDTGNLYARIVPSIMDRETAIFKSRLEQAVFFGASKQSPLVFPLRPEQVDVPHAVKSFSDQIMNMNCKLFPSCENMDLFLRSRYFFERRIMILLKENVLIEMVPQTIRNELIKRVEYYLLSFILWEFHQERIGDNVSTVYWENIITDLVLEPKENLVQDLLIKHPFRILDFLNKVRSNVLIQGIKMKNAKEQMTLIYSTNELMMRVTQQTYRFEKKYRKNYQVAMNYDDLISSQLNDMIFLLFELNVKYIVNNNTDEEIMNSDQMKIMKESLYQLSNILLDILLEAATHTKMNIEQYQYDYETVRKSVIEGLCKTNLCNKAIEVAEKHHDVSSLVVSVQTSRLSPQEMQEMNSKFIQLFQQDYYNALLTYLDKDHQNNHEKLILTLLSEHSRLATHLLDECIFLKVAWKYYLQQKNYKKALESIQLCIQHESDPTQLKLYDSWMQIFEAALLS